MRLKWENFLNKIRTLRLDQNLLECKCLDFINLGRSDSGVVIKKADYQRIQQHAARDRAYYGLKLSQYVFSHAERSIGTAQTLQKTKMNAIYGENSYHLNIIFG